MDIRLSKETKSYKKGMERKVEGKEKSDLDLQKADLCNAIEDKLRTLNNESAHFRGDPLRRIKF